MPVCDTVHYFPKNVLASFFYVDGEKKVFGDDDSEYSQLLFKMDEPVLCNKYLNKDIYRLTILRSFRPNIILRLEKSNDTVYLIEKDHIEYISNRIIYENNVRKNILDSVKYHHYKTISSIEIWDKLEDILKQINYQSLPSSTSMDFGPDGEELIFEKHTKKGYYVVKRSSYGINFRNLKRLGDFFIKNSRYKLETID